MAVSEANFSSNDHTNASITSSNSCEPATPVGRAGMPKHGPFDARYDWPRRWRENEPFARHRGSFRPTVDHTNASHQHFLCGL